MRGEISRQAVQVWRALEAAAGKWLTTRDVMCASEASPRTVWCHLLALRNLGLIEEAKVFLAHRYRIMAGKRTPEGEAHVKQLAWAAEVFGLPPVVAEPKRRKAA